MAENYLRLLNFLPMTDVAGLGLEVTFGPDLLFIFALNRLLPNFPVIITLQWAPFGNL